MIQFCICVYIFFFIFFSHIGYYRILCRVPCAISKFLMLVFLISVYCSVAALQCRVGF